MKISKMNYVTVFCSALFAVSFIIATAAGSILLATIPPQNSKSSAVANAPSGDQNLAKAMPESREIGVTSGNKEVKYSLLCGIVSGTLDKTTGKPVLSPPLQKDVKFGQGTCILLDVSTPKASKVPGELQASKLIHKIDPIYPVPAIKEHVGIRALLSINVNEEGLVTDAGVRAMQTIPPDRDSNGNWVGGVHSSVTNSIKNTVINAVKQWKYSPTLLNGKAIPVRVTVSIDFTFNKDGSPKISVFP